MFSSFILPAVCPNMANLNETSGVLTSLTIQGGILLVRHVFGKLQRVKENALCWSSKTYISETVVHLARTICKYKMAHPLMASQAGEDVEALKTVG